METEAGHIATCVCVHACSFLVRPWIFLPGVSREVITSLETSVMALDSAAVEE